MIQLILIPTEREWETHLFPILFPSRHWLINQIPYVRLWSHQEITDKIEKEKNLNFYKVIQVQKQNIPSLPPSHTHSITYMYTRMHSCTHTHMHSTVFKFISPFKALGNKGSHKFQKCLDYEKNTKTITLWI